MVLYGVYRGIWCCIGVYRGIWCCMGYIGVIGAYGVYRGVC